MKPPAALCLVLLFACGSTETRDDPRPSSASRSADAELGAESPAPRSPQDGVQGMVDSAHADRAGLDVIDGWVVSVTDGVKRDFDGQVTTAPCGTLEDVEARKADDVRKAVRVVGCRSASTGAPPAGVQHVVTAAALAASIAGAASDQAAMRTLDGPLKALGIFAKPEDTTAHVPDARLVLDTDTATLLGGPSTDAR